MIMFCLPATGLADDIETLANVHQALSKKFDEVSHLSAEQLESLPSEQVLILDVREAEEYAVSHLDNALRVDPGISNRQFMQQFESDLQNKIVIFYCSVGYRSSDLAEDLQEGLVQNGAKAVYNLEEGIFGWHNADMPLVNDTGKTSRIHPYDDHWGRLIVHQQDVSYEP